jgi:hypothetical protein
MVLGNHDINFLAMRRLDPRRVGQHMRPHTAKNLAQAATTLAEASADPMFFIKADAFLARKPLWLENHDLRVVHACPDVEALKALISSGHLDPEGRLTDDPVKLADITGYTSPGDLRALIAIGPEFDLPPGQSYLDHEGNERTKDRLPWWLDGRFEEHHGSFTAFGHHAMAPGDAASRAEPFHASRSFCVDRSLGKGGPLCILHSSPRSSRPVSTTLIEDCDTEQSL